MKIYELIENSNSNNLNLKTEVYYHKGGMNYFTGNNEPRGYYISCTPVNIERNGLIKIESFTAFTGRKKLLIEVQRKSDKMYNKAVEYAKEWQPILREKILETIKNK